MVKSSGNVGVVTNKLLITILLAITGFFCANLYYRIVSIQSDIVKVQLDLTKLRGELVGKDEIRDIVITEIYKYHKAIHHETMTTQVDGP